MFEISRFEKEQLKNKGIKANIYTTMKTHSGRGKLYIEPYSNVKKALAEIRQCTENEVK